MSEPLQILDLFVRGAAAGIMAAWALAICRSAVSRQAKLSTALVALSTIAWLITESHVLAHSLGDTAILVAISYPVGGFFWLFMMTVFEDRPLRPVTLAPAALLLATGLVMGASRSPMLNWLWIAFNGFSGLLAVHVAYIIIRGWRGDLVEGRRRLRAMLMGSVSLFVILQVAAGFIWRFDPESPWRVLGIGQIGGGTLLTLLVMGGTILFLQARPTIFGSGRRADAGPDARAEAADRQLMAKLDGFMAEGGWKTEGLTIGAVAQALDTPEHRLRRLINQRLGHRNFADFVNSHRIAAAKRRLADATEARTTVATIAFELGYGSLGPFNRAFRAATGATPTEWRRQALADELPILDEAV